MGKKGADQLDNSSVAVQPGLEHILFFLNPKSEASSHLYTCTCVCIICGCIAWFVWELVQVTLMSGSHILQLIYEPRHKETNFLVSDLVLQKIGCTATEMTRGLKFQI